MAEAVVKRRKKQVAPTQRISWSLVLLAVPGVLYLLVFNYLPMAGLVVAFKDFNVADGIFGSPWNGVENFEYFISTRSGCMPTSGSHSPSCSSRTSCRRSSSA
jgi:putative aldouronate transport system permease protein